MTNGPDMDTGAAADKDTTRPAGESIGTPAAMPAPDVLTAALGYAARGWRVFPVRGKRPALDLAPRWSESSTTDPAMIASWYAGTTGLGVAVDLGASGLVVVDTDHPELIPADWPDLTGWPYRGNPDRASFLYRRNGTPVPQASHPWGELKGAGGYVVLPPSPHPSGVAYRWLLDRLDGDPPTLPADLAALVAPARPNVPTGEPWTPDRVPTSAEHEVAVEHVGRWLDVVAATPEGGGRYGGRNRTLFVASVVAGHLCPHYLDPDRAAAALVIVADTCGLVADDGRAAVEATIRSGLRTGMVEPQAVPVPTTTAGDVARPFGSWSPVPLTVAAAESSAAARPTVLRYDSDTDGVGLFYPGRVSVVSGEPGNGKTWVLVAAVADAARRGDRVLILDLEDTGDTWLGRLRGIGVVPEALSIAYVRPDVALPAGDVLDELARDRGLVVVDGMTDLYALHSLSPDSDADTARVFRWLTRLAAGGAAVVATDHVTKSTEQRRYQRGSGHKLAAVTGVGYRLDPDPATGAPAPGVVGRGRLVVTKDKPGGTGYRRDDVAGIVELDATRAPARLVVRRPPGSGRSPSRGLSPMVAAP